MQSYVRMRCPCCGMLVWQDRLNNSYPFEFVRQDMSGGGRGGRRIEYTRGGVADSEDARTYQGLLALKMVEKARRLLDEIGADVDIRVYSREDRSDEDEAQDGGFAFSGSMADDAHAAASGEAEALVGCLNEFT